MRSRVSDRSTILVLAALVIASVGLKAIVQPVGAPISQRAVATTVARRLASHGFQARVRQREFIGFMVEAARGACRITVRDASDAVDAETAFDLVARDVGKVSYLYDGRRYRRPPALRMRVGRFANDLGRAFGFILPVKAPIALAASPACGDDRFGLDRVLLRDA